MTFVVVTVNGSRCSVDETMPLSFRDVADLAKVMTDSPSMTLKSRGTNRIMKPGQTVMPLDDMVFNVYDTSFA